MISRPLSIACAVLCLTGSGLFGHEFWLSPQAYKVAPGDRLKIDLRNGERFSGSSFPYFRGRLTRFDLVQNGQPAPYEGRLGDIPALDMQVVTPGLLVVVHETTPSTLTYSDWQKFETFARHKDFAHILDQHRTRGLPKTGFKENYTRHAKALVAVGDGSGADVAQGLAVEFVAQTNPYNQQFDLNMQVRLLVDQAPRPDTQVEIFDRSPDGTVTIFTTRTDAEGRAQIPVTRGHDYLLDAVVARALPGSDNEPVWETRWGALTFSVPLD